jgi:SAM-dependent methyltransferase
MNAMTRGRVRSPLAERRCDSAYYQRLHDTSTGYQHNNWLLDELPVLRAFGGCSLVELGCGNGRFLAQAARHWAEVTGVDWARSPVLDAVLRRQPRIRFVQQDATQLSLPGCFDLLVSADFLEHVPPPLLPGLIARMNAAATTCFHKIACYDDGHSHLSIFDAATWLALFHAAAPSAGYRLMKASYRHAGHAKPVIVLSNASAGQAMAPEVGARIQDGP